MNGTQEANGRNEGEGNSQQDVTLPDAQAEPGSAAADQPEQSEQSEQPEQPPAEPPTPAKKNPGLKFLEYVVSFPRPGRR